MTKKFALLLFAFALSVSSASGKEGLDIKHWQSAAGVKVLFVESRALPILDIRLDFAAGSMFESRDKAGLAALTNAMLSLGAGDLSEMEISNRLADVGAILFSHVGSDSAGLSLRVLSTPEKQEAALEVLIAILSSPRFETAIFERERERVIARLKDSLTRPGTLANRALTAAMYPDHPYGFLSTPENLAGIMVEDANQFWKKNYVAKGAVLSIVGDLDRISAEKLSERLSAALSTGKVSPLPSPPYLFQSIRSAKNQEIRIPHPASQAHIYLGMVAIARDDPDFFPIVVGNYILGGGGFSSRLMEEVREKRGYAYSVYSNFSPQKQAGPFAIVLETRKEQADDALKLTLDILSDFLEKGPTAAEVAAAKAYLAGSFPLRLDSNQKILGQVAVIGIYDLPLNYLAQYQKRIEAVQIADIRAAFSRHVNMERLVTVVVGEAAKKPQASEIQISETDEEQVTAKP